MSRYPESMPKSRAWYERATQVMPGGNTRTTVYMNPIPVYVTHGAGCKVWDADGHAYYDCINNFTSLIHGHAHPGIVAAAQQQLPLGTAFGSPTLSEIELAELLVDRVPSIEQIRFANSGTEAVMMSIKAARAYTSRPKIVKIEGSYHGSYDFAEVSLDSSPQNWGDQSPASTAYARGTPQGVLEDVLVVPFNDTGRLQQVFAAHGPEIAAVLIDPMPNRVGLIPADRAYLTSLIDTAHAAGALVIFDEVITFRLGYHGAQGLWGLAPDITALGKIIGGGFPVGAIGGKREIMAVFDPSRGKPALPHGGTFTANPMTMRAGLAAMQALSPESFAALDALGEQARAHINQSLRRLDLPGQCVGLGSLFKVHFTAQTGSDYRSVYPGPAAQQKLKLFHRGLLDRGVITATYALFALSTPMTQQDLQNILHAIDETLEEIAMTDKPSSAT